VAWLHLGACWHWRCHLDWHTDANLSMLPLELCAQIWGINFRLKLCAGSTSGV